MIRHYGIHQANINTTAKTVILSVPRRYGRAWDQLTDAEILATREWAEWRIKEHYPGYRIDIDENR